VLFYSGPFELLLVLGRSLALSGNVNAARVDPASEHMGSFFAHMPSVVSLWSDP
jgi:hypothetical protein